VPTIVLTDIDETAVICLRELDESAHKSCKMTIRFAKLTRNIIYVKIR